MPTTPPPPGGAGGALKSLARIFRERASFEMREEEVEALGAEVEKASLGGGGPAPRSGGGGGGAGLPASSASSSPPQAPAVQLPPIAADVARLEAEAAEDEAWQVSARKEKRGESPTRQQATRDARGRERAGPRGPTLPPHHK
jgi:hypothetical protein